MDYIQIESLEEAGLITEEQAITAMLKKLMMENEDVEIYNVIIGGRNVERIG